MSVPQQQTASQSHSSRPSTHAGIPQQAQRREADHPGHDSAAFRPFFTLIEDSDSSRFYHPTVHYIFSDDDTDLITEAAVRSLEQQQHAPQPPQPTKGRQKAPATTKRKGEGDRNNNIDDHLYPGNSDTPEHFIILDIEPASHTSTHHQHQLSNTSSSTVLSPATILPNPSSPNTIVHPSPSPNAISSLPSHYNITSAHSLSPTWQLLTTHLTPAPTFDASLSPAATDATDPSPLGGGLMLRIEATRGSSDVCLHGTGAGADKSAGGGGGGGTGAQSLQEMMELFEKRMADLRKVVDASEMNGGEMGEGGRGEEE